MCGRAEGSVLSWCLVGCLFICPFQRGQSDGGPDFVDDVFVRFVQQEYGQLQRFFHTDASMADGAVFARESPFVVCVVKEDGKAVGEPEYQPSQGVPFAIVLSHTVLAAKQHGGSDGCRVGFLVRRLVDDAVAVTGKVGHVSGMSWGYLVFDDAVGDVSAAVSSPVSKFRENIPDITASASAD